MVAADPSPLAPAQYAADVRVAPPRDRRPGLRPVPGGARAREHDVKAVIPLTDLDLEVLARSDLPAFVPAPEVCRATYDKYETHELLLSHGLPSPPTVLPGEEPDVYPVDGQAAPRLRRALDPPRRRPRARWSSSSTTSTSR